MTTPTPEEVEARELWEDIFNPHGLITREGYEVEKIATALASAFERGRRQGREDMEAQRQGWIETARLTEERVRRECADALETLYQTKDGRPFPCDFNAGIGCAIVSVGGVERLQAIRAQSQEEAKP